VPHPGQAGRSIPAPLLVRVGTKALIHGGESPEVLNVWGMIGVTSGDGSVRRPGCRSLSIISSIWRNATTGATSNRVLDAG
jgi:hypothetical protein